MGRLRLQIISYDPSAFMLFAMFIVFEKSVAVQEGRGQPHRGEKGCHFSCRHWVWSLQSYISWT